MSACGIFLVTLLRGALVGTDAFGNRYFESRGRRKDGHPRRWVRYRGQAEGSKVPAEWHAWLHYTADAPLTDSKRWPWQKAHLPNLSGTLHAYRPPGHLLQGGQRDKATGDYEPWFPS
jgi:NADH:ubiquinone oxidoreductase subunit